LINILNNMKTKTSFIGGQIAPVKNKKVIKADIYEPCAVDICEPDESDIYEPDDYDYLFKENLRCEIERLGEGLCYLCYLADRYADAEKNLIKMENIIITSIGRDSYEDMLDLIHHHKERSERDIEESYEQSAVLNSYYLICE
jgi:hypothetical protein